VDSELQKDLWLDLLNSDWHDFRGEGRDEDRLDRGDWLAKFLAPWRAWLGDVPQAEARERLKGLRALLRRMADDFAARRPLARADLERLNRVLQGGPRVQRVDASGRSYSLRLIPRDPGIGALLAEIAASFAGVLARGEPERVKTCRNPDCRWVFYDRSKNRSRKWCENATGCGNLIKVRNFRARAGAGGRRRPREESGRG
jgi:predicted RNA-binding Zn ribbon-like protein